MYTRVNRFFGFLLHAASMFELYLDPGRLDWIRGHIDAALEADREEQRRQTLREIEEQLRDEASVIFLYHRKLNTFLHPSVRGVISLNSLGWMISRMYGWSNCRSRGKGESQTS
ncbi:hypothetical protein [Paenibacillus sp. LHD-38]|uniref:hypothetical protein n=1 Tax=Paenibacillus sp. LHD-38 TaxID=3072143 RepID=UPI00280F1B69|nr:hypothetical protein [Paenibacillus sp. LHD-38]MDQ8734300.1 hypothetical protein [Paenibacillus sp. LHD-38]